ncbi:MAG: hypothetical protein IH586_20220 [Anaerolineaceae bacterium]|nr:hypothetical protein [Anaerolineaceae bacterium]
MVVPFIIVLGLPFLVGIKTSDWGSFLYLIIGYASTGFMEEGLMRGTSGACSNLPEPRAVWSTRPCCSA